MTEPVAALTDFSLSLVRNGIRNQVLERIDNMAGVGCAKIEGEVWTARAFDEDRIIEPGERVEVIQIRGATALVD